MFRNMTEEGHLSGGPSPSHSAGLGVASHGYVSHESSWISLLSVLSRPALSFLQKYLPGRSLWFSRDEKMNFVSEQSTFLNPLYDAGSAADARQLRCDSDGATCRLAEVGGAGLLWEPGLEQSHVTLNQQTQTEYLTTARTLLGQILLSSVSGERSLRTADRRQRRNWWDRFWSSEDCSQSSELLFPQPLYETKSPVSVFVYNSGGASTLGEHAGLCDHKDKPGNKGHLQSEQLPNTRNHLRTSGAVTPCSEVTITTSDQDNGYSSLEEEHLHVFQMYTVMAQSEAVPPTARSSAMQVGTDGQDESTTEKEEAADGPEEFDSRASNDEGEHEVVTQSPSAAAELTTLQCSNKVIAYIMGCPCSDDDNQSESSSDDDDDDDDDGFDSECSSELSDLSDDDDDDEASDSDSETDVDLAHMWTLYQSHDPYNPQNFTACIRTCTTTLPKSAPTTTSSVQSTPTSDLDEVGLSLACSSSLPEYPSLSSSTPESHDVWDDSASASDTDEAENLRIWSSFSCTSDPYSPLNFQASVRTRESAKVDEKTFETPPHTHYCNATLLAQYKKEADDRMDSGFCETQSSTGGAVVTKKVRFCEEVEEFFASCGEEEEDRRGPWEQLARDRCRFLRRCQEVEQSIAFCLQPQHRRHVLLRQSAALAQDSLGRRTLASMALSEDAETDAGFSAR
ncbi:protein phosphatase 1 regulatory subunit 15B-like isoform X2 [Thalassophryne amazonica]|uniref:protein phosphatase 1 regulatory subunit 15B-like isoform X1 n=1 Tax=Thalassophryne amazonica TaxID=390379 RepID=UPI0014714E4A|nr:protein phosphatase 1 regulatory subunit 15B-like isoform X1 [Thalassophryne amazonica]XP_034021288.1 protein phosphatase 1 regulatory subunit 15B-like isoform X2 [Thalassophryne amazonica]